MGDELKASLNFAKMLRSGYKAGSEARVKEEIRGMLAVDLYLIARKQRHDTERL